MIDSFGYRVMSLREVITELTAMGERLPELMDQPLWVGGAVPLYIPVTHIIRAQHGAMVVTAVAA